MSGRVLFIGAGDVGLRMANGLLAKVKLDRVVLSDWNAELVAPRAAMLGNCHGARVDFQQIDGRDKAALEALVRSADPDLIVQCASLISPWTIIGNPHPLAQKLGKAGIALQIPAQLPILKNVMEVVGQLGRGTPVANMTMPDILHPFLEKLGAAPKIGLGNVSIHHLRVRHRLLERDDTTGDEMLRLLGHHCQVYDVMQAKQPAAEEDRVRVFLGPEGARADHLAYEGVPFQAGQIYNEITAASAIPVLMALLPDASPLQYSAPAPFGLPGGYPIVIEGGEVALDLPPGVSRDDAIRFNSRQGIRDGVERIDPDGTVHLTGAVKAAVADIDPVLAEPIAPGNLAARTEKLLDIVSGLTEK